MRLSPCATCTRLVRSADAACPFCGATVVHPAPRAASPPRRLHRAALLGAAAVAAACGSEVSQPVYGAPAYGAIFVDSGTDAGKDAGPDAHAAPDAVMGAYGLPPMDSGADSGKD